MSGHKAPEPRIEPISTLIPTVAKAHRKLAGSLLHDLGLAPGQELALMLLWEESPRSQADLTRLLMVESPTTAKMLARLERAGVITRERSATDRRVVLVSLTAEGRSLEEPVTAVWRDLEQRTTADLTPAEQDQLRALLGRVAGTLTED
ncbi:MarR family winged helix-turn-helix transcriptional regulator [Rathayibacter tanaceti]|uniref:MarR family transcriptional regulator n=2 Tax=Rathayibacter tanaceti TaxID=1671680 RepID=A0A166H4P7_9MICO|nr:MarR family transcriptional regulator [Rathayibacter tanaceti]KZX19941.1 Organic hydroperoxide resistance transcriptional regulator [Rathayibacter tanaceti]QHC54651.1 MarR family transcriptional regulator [Rathayibacter tanaceti]TCO37544.1 DNA-binding MarR family transcriptional regulator [Rathayibacter tanaceti]